ncbi:hypothetical protein R3P38DRAFT_3337732 [Favolaschia claudopus]|uniref:Uncharacterized protein n=1 Tax=Favolaschia claudopus TaxID=2862362 RepID=A0AAV9Z0B3_9AGAR
MATPAVPQDLYSYCTLLRSELQRVHDRLDRLEFGNTAASTPRGHAWRFSWDGARWGSEPSTPAPTPAIIAVGHTAIPLAVPLLVAVYLSVGTDQQIGEALIALGKRFMCKRIRSKKKGPVTPFRGPCPSPSWPVPVLPNACVREEGQW